MHQNKWTSPALYCQHARQSALTLYELYGIPPSNLPPRVAIVIPVYNGARYLAMAVESALAQDYPDIQVIIVNDGSTDETGSIAQQYVGDPRVKYIEKDNGGVATALNAGVQAMDASFFCWLSHDDVYYPTKISTQIGYYQIFHPGENVVLFSDYDLINSQGTVIQRVAHDHGMLESQPEYAILRGRVHGCTVLVPRGFFDEIGLFDPNLPYTQDYDLWSRALSLYRFVHIPEALIQSRWHDEQGSKKGDYSREFNSLWISVMNRTTPEQRIALEGNEYLFYTGMEQFLHQASATDAANHAADMAARTVRDTLVSVVIPFHRNLQQLRAAIGSVLAQTHQNTEILVVYDEADQDISCAVPEGMLGVRVFGFKQDGRGAGSARNYGIQKARGHYIAFLDSDDLFLPTKIETQLTLMMRNRARFSHTSYFAHGQTRVLPSALHSSGTFSGCVFPGIINFCPVAMPTVMVEKQLVAEQYPLPNDAPNCEDFVWLVRMSHEIEVLGIDEPLTVVLITPDSVAYSRDRPLRYLR